MKPPLSPDDYSVYMEEWRRAFAEEKAARKLEQIKVVCEIAKKEFAIACEEGTMAGYEGAYEILEALLKEIPEIIENKDAKNG